MTGCNGRCCVAFPMNDLKHADIVAWRDKHPDYLEYDKYVDMLIVIDSCPSGADVFTCRHQQVKRKRAVCDPRRLPAGNRRPAHMDRSWVDCAPMEA